MKLIRKSVVGLLALALFFIYGTAVTASSSSTSLPVQSIEKIIGAQGEV